MHVLRPEPEYVSGRYCYPLLYNQLYVLPINHQEETRNGS